MPATESGTSAPRNISLIECRISQNGGDGLRVEGTGTADIRTYGGKFGKNGGIGLNVIEADAVQASKINSTGNTGGDISIGSAVAGSKFDVSTLTVDVATNVILPTPNTNKNVFTYKGEDYMDVKDYGGGGGGGDVTINTYTANHTLTSADASAYVDMDLATDGTLTVPPNSSEPFSVGNQTTVRAHGLGQITIVEGAGVTIYTPDTLVLRKQFSSVTLVKRGTDEWDLMGDVELFA
jgi:hypothetical protein